MKCPVDMRHLLSEMVNVMCQLDWAMRCPDIWSYIILGVSVGVTFG